MPEKNTIGVVRQTNRRQEVAFWCSNLRRSPFVVVCDEWIARPTSPIAVCSPGTARTAWDPQRTARTDLREEPTISFLPFNFNNFFWRQKRRRPGARHPRKTTDTRRADRAPFGHRRPGGRVVYGSNRRRKFVSACLIRRPCSRVDVACVQDSILLESSSHLPAGRGSPPTEYRDVANRRTTGRTSP